MASLSYNTARFTNVNKWDENYSYKGILVAGKLNQKNGQGYPLIDAIDIDWNGGWLTTLNTYINTTSDLLIAIDKINKTSDVESALENIDAFKNLLDTIINSYVTHQELPDILSSYQRVLNPGAYIAIDQDTDTISAYGLVQHDQLGELLTGYTTNYTFNIFEQFVNNNFYIKSETDEVARKAAEDEVKRVIDGADEAFDTLKEVADWINAQSRYEPVAYEDMILDGSVEYYIYNTETDSYDNVTVEYIQEHPEEQYYRKCDTSTDVADLFNAITTIQQTIGTKTDLGDGSYAYTGMKKDIYNLQYADHIINIKLNNAVNTALEARETAEAAVITADNAYSYALLAYDVAAYSLEITHQGIDQALEAYQIAVKAREDVGVPSVAGYFYELTDEIKTQIGAGELEVGQTYIINNITGEYIESDYDPDSEETFYAYMPAIEATGLTLRVETVEARADELQEDVDNATYLAKTSLYHLYVDNSNSPYVSLSLSPTEYIGGQGRTLNIATETATFDPETGEILHEGIPSITTVQDIYSYASSWQVLPSPSEYVITTSAPEEYDLHI